MTLDAFRDAVIATGFTHGVYRHYKGDLFSTMTLVVHHETRQPMVVYVSHKYGWVNCRPLRGWYKRVGDSYDPAVATDLDGFLDEVTWPDGRVAPRFELVMEAKL